MRWLALLCLVACQAPDSASTLARPGSEDAPRFPQDWLGTWEGEVSTARPGQALAPRFRMTRIVEATDDPMVYRWTTIYSGEAGDQTREYLLRVIDPSIGQYAIDEQNDIVLDATLVGDTLISWFEVQGTTLMVREQLDRFPDGHPAWAFEIFTGLSTPRETGKAVPVNIVPVSGAQRAWLRKRLGD
jgi:hypothetical protein